MKKISISIISVFILFVSASFLVFQSCEEKPLVVQGNIEGNVVDSETQENLSGVNVTIVSNSSATFAEQSKLTGGDGKFSFKDLEAGNYKLTFSKEGYENNSKNIALAAGQTSSSDVSLKSIKSAISVSSTLLDFGQNTSILPVEIRNTGKGELNWSIAEDLNWLSANPTSGKITTEPVSVSVTVDRSLITGDSKTGSFVINSNGGSVVVNVTVGKAGPILNVTPATLDFGATEMEKSINVSNAGVGTLSYTATTAQSWITLENATSSVTTDTKIIKVKVARTSLSPGSYTGNVVINSNSNSITVPVSMSVIQPTAPDLLNGQASGITHNSAQASGTLTSLGSSAITQHGHCWSTSPNPTTANNKTTLGGTGVLKSFTSDLTGLSAATTYYVKAYATNAVGTTYSDAITFTTLAPPTVATVQTTRTENIKHNQIDGVGNLTVLGDGLVTDYGFCYSSSNATPTTNDSKKSLGQTTQSGSFTATVSGLQTSTKYYLRAYAVNSMGTAYGGVVEATTTDAPSVVTNGLVAYYTFDDDNCNEARGNSQYNGVKQGNGNPVWSTDIPGSAGKALQLNNDVYYQIATNPIKYTAQYSHSIWLKMTNNCNIFMPQTTLKSNYSGLVIKDNKVSSGAYWDGYTYGAFFSIDVSGLLLDGNWHLLIVTRNASSIKLYIDGIYLAEVRGPITNAITTNYPLQLGEGFTGKMDNFRAYNRELVQSEITEIYNAKQ
ncbi:MAG: carboxypeptidase regulatory-like domain-containing protein [Prevotella sp.]|jgi:hypothetical protein|nr:carboxypeptidase regulatory-like domain-containing protein [Prevotella sp.]